jgi:hypothetical protein
MDVRTSIIVQNAGFSFYRNDSLLYRMLPWRYADTVMDLYERHPRIIDGVHFIAVAWEITSFVMHLLRVPLPAQEAAALTNFLILFITTTLAVCIRLNLLLFERLLGSFDLRFYIFNTIMFAVSICFVFPTDTAPIVVGARVGTWVILLLYAILTDALATHSPMVFYFSGLPTALLFIVVYFCLIFEVGILNKKTDNQVNLGDLATFWSARVTATTGISNQVIYSLRITRSIVRGISEGTGTYSTVNMRVTFLRKKP